MGRIFGYARVSTDDQDLALQVDALNNSGADHLYTDRVSGVREDRPGLDACLAALEEGDTLIVWRLDRLGRSVIHLVKLVTELKDRGIHFKSVQDGSIDTTTASGELIFTIFAALAQFERALIRERTRAGLAAAKARGRNGGRPRVPATDPKVKMAKELKDSNLPIREICDSLKISRTTYYRYLNMED